ncbi:RES family NAD+ phosphorylase [Mucilaginibacter arboris]|uniref:RES domain-containing protein n=1 Tax=Mucilaginibacter arboris TaxID=2682090 RepID=A0A7K1SSQ6_9SPHI|nr:RES family NAD+ phosphorylase [Mucilaginibacter arboris]MVN20348.1 RES domain-containing protein [Mucilaginibacter arboris]
MFVYRITLSVYADVLKASGRAARWNPNKTEMIYTASNRSLACLENVVHRGQLGLSQIFSIMTIEIDDKIKKEKVHLSELPKDWKEFDQMPFTQTLGEKWITANRTAVLEVPSSIIDEEVNYLINPNHADFKLIEIIKTDPFVFDQRIKL